MKRFLCIFLLLVMVLLTACGGDGADKPRKTKFSDGGYMLTWSDENGKTTRMENYAKEGWFNTTEYEHDEDGNTTVMRDLDENDQELSRVQYYYKNGEKVAEERYENNVLDRKYYYEGDKKVGQEVYENNVLSKKMEYDYDEKLIYLEQYDENGELIGSEELVELDGTEAWLICDATDEIQAIRIVTNGNGAQDGRATSYTFTLDEEGYVIGITETDVENFVTQEREITDPDEQLELLELLRPFAAE